MRRRVRFRTQQQSHLVSSIRHWSWRCGGMSTGSTFVFTSSASMDPAFSIRWACEWMADRASSSLELVPTSLYLRACTYHDGFWRKLTNSDEGIPKQNVPWRILTNSDEFWRIMTRIKMLNKCLVFALFREVTNSDEFWRILTVPGLGILNWFVPRSGPNQFCIQVFRTHMTHLKYLGPHLPVDSLPGWGLDHIRELWAIGFSFGVACVETCLPSGVLGPGANQSPTIPCACNNSSAASMGDAFPERMPNTKKTNSNQLVGGTFKNTHTPPMVTLPV